MSAPSPTHWYVRSETGFEPTGIAVAGHDTGAQHGSAVAGLIARAVEQVDSPVPMQIVRMTIDLTRRVPFGLTTIETNVRRAGRRVQLVEAILYVDGQPLTRSEVLRIRTADVVDAADQGDPGPELPGATRPSPWSDSEFLAPFDLAVEQWDRGVGRMWISVPDVLVEGESMSPAMRAAVAADMAPTAGRLLETYAATNVDLHLALFRPPDGTRFLLDAVNQANEGGWGSTACTLYDERGRVGVSTKSLIVLG